MKEAVSRLRVGSVARSMLSMSAARIAALGIGFVASVIVTRSLGPSGRGALAVASAITTIGVQIGSAGVPASNTYLVAREPRRRLELVRRTGRLTALVALAVAVLGVLARLLDVSPLDDDLLLLSLAAIPVGVAFSCLQYLMLGLGRVKIFWRMDLANRGMYLLAVVAAVLIVDRLTTGPVLAFSLASVALVAVGALRLAQRSDPSAAQTDDDIRQSGDGRYILKMYVATSLSYMVLRANVLIADRLLPSSDVGAYAAATTLVEPVIVIPMAMSTVLFAEAASESSESNRWELFTRSLRWIGGISVVLSLLFLLVAPLLIEIAYGEEFSHAVPLLRVLAASMVPFAAAQVAWNYLRAIGLPTWTVMVWLMAAVCSLAGTALLSGQHGIEVVAWISLATYTTVAVLFVAGAWRSARAA